MPRPEHRAGPAVGCAVARLCQKRRSSCHPSFAALFLIALLLGAPGPAGAERRFAFDLPTAPLGASLDRFAKVTGSQFVYASDLAHGHFAPAIHGRLTSSAALRRMLAGTGIVAREPTGGVIVLLGSGAQPIPQQPSRLAPSVSEHHTAVRDAEEPMADIVVTGTNLRDTMAAPPLMVLRPDRAAGAGATDLAGMLLALPIGFASATEATVLSGADRSGLNYSLGTAIDLHGLGRAATLVLVDGRRVAGSGERADFTDLSLIPMAAVERIDVLPDGASAIYGADAVAGVVNIVLKGHADGIDVRSLGGGATRGGLGHHRLSLRYGLRWPNGGFVLVGEFDRRGALAASDRATTRSDDLRPFGGSDWRSTLSSPPTILSTDRPGSGPFAVQVAAAGQSDAAITVVPGINLQNQNLGLDLLARQTRALFSARVHLALSDRVTLMGDVRFAARRFSFASPASATTATITTANPYFLSVDGATSEVLGYSFIGTLGPSRTTGHVAAFSAGLGLTADIGRGWHLDLHAGHSSEAGRERQSNLANAARFEAALGMPGTEATGFSASRYGWFDPYGTAKNAPALLTFVGSGFASERRTSLLDTVDIKTDGLITLGRNHIARLALGGGVRREGQSWSGLAFYDGVVPQPVAAIAAARTVESLFAELAVPLWRDAPTASRRVDLSLAARAEHHPQFGSTLNPRLSVTVTPARGIAWRTNWGTSFRAPSLIELRGAASVTPTSLLGPDGAVPTLVLSGGNSHLRAETAHSVSSTLTIEPEAAHGWNLSLGGFRSRFGNRIAQPALDGLPGLLSDPALRDFVTAIDPAHNAEDLSEAAALLAASGSVAGAAPADAYRLIVDARPLNTAALLVSGIDASIGWGLQLSDGRLDLAVSATRLLSYRERLAAGARFVDRLGVTGYPSTLRARATISWSGRTLDFALGLNHVAGSRDDQGTRQRVDDWRTLDARIGWHPSGNGGPVLTVDVANLLDRAPPFADRASGFGYDAPNADIAGRIVSLELRWAL